MGSSINRRVLSLATALAFVISLLALDSRAGNVKAITEVEVQQEAGMTRIILRGAADPIYTAFLREDPPRLIIELPDVTFDGLETPISLDDGVVNRVAFASFGDSEGSSAMMRISIGLEVEADYEIVPSGDELEVQVRSLSASARVPTAVSPVQPEPAPASMDDSVQQPAGLEAEPTPAPSVEDPMPGQPHAKTEVQTEQKPSPKNAPKASGHEQGARIVGLVAGGEEVHVLADGPLDRVDAFRLNNPERLVVDFWGAHNTVFPNKFSVDSGLIQLVRIGQHPDKVRVVMDLRGEVGSHVIETTDNGVRIALESSASEPEEKPAAPQPEPEEAPVISQPEPVSAAPLPEIDNEDGQGGINLGQTVWVRDVQYESLPDADRIILTIGGKLEAIVAEPDPITIVIDLPGSRIEGEIERRVDTKEFGGPLEMFSVFQTPDVPQDQVRIVLKRRGSDKAQLMWEDGRLLVSLPRSSGTAYVPRTTVPTQISSQLPAPDLLSSEPQGPSASAMRVSQTTPAGVRPAPPRRATQLSPMGARPVSPLGTSPLLIQPLGAVPASPFGGNDPLLAGPAEPASIDILQEGGFDGEKNYNGRRISLDFKDADIANILRLIAEVSDLNIIAGEEVEGKVTIRLVDVPWDQAMDVILLTKGLGFTRVGNVLRIAPLETLKAEQEARLMERRSKEKLEDLVVKLQPVNYADVNEMKDLIQRLLSPRGSVNVDERTSTLIIKDIPSVIHEATALVKAIDTQTPQVLIEAKIVEANLTFARALGARWGVGFTGNQTGDPGGLLAPSAGGNQDLRLATAASGLDPLVPMPNGEQQTNFISSNPVLGLLNGALRLGLLGHDDRLQLDLDLMAAESNNRGKVISSPRVVTLDNREAIIKQGVAIKFTEITRDTVTTSFVDAVLELKVTPHITANRSIIMKLKVSRNAPNLSSASGEVVGISKNETETEALVRDGETMVLGGIYVVDNGRTRSKFPFLADIPLLGVMFRSSAIQDERRELLIFVTPRIVTSPSSDI